VAAFLRRAGSSVLTDNCGGDGDDDADDACVLYGCSLYIVLL